MFYSRYVIYYTDFLNTCYARLFYLRRMYLSYNYE